MSKAEKTTQYIIDTVTPIFNKKGYAATSMKDITLATGLTKGAIYGNFKNKEELAVAAFNTSVKRILSGVQMRMRFAKTALEKLFKIVEFYSEYYDYTEDLGGCPVLNTGIDSNNQNLALQERVREIIIKLQNEIAQLIDKAIKDGEIKASTNSFVYAKRIFVMIEGGIFMSTIMKDPSYLIDSTNRINKMIHSELLK